MMIMRRPMVVYLSYTTLNVENVYIGQLLSCGINYRRV